MKDLRILSCAGQFNHHAVFMCDSLHNRLSDDYRRVSTEDISNERIALGFKQEISRDYNINIKKTNLKQFENLIEKFDIIEYGSAPESFLNLAIKNDKIVFIRLERIFKKGLWQILYPPAALKYYKKYIKHKNNKNVYFLCTSAYAAWDLKRIGIDNNRVLSWAYCPEYIEYNETDIHQFRNTETVNILWLGRLIEWKHPHVAIDIARKLKKNRIDFTMTIAGTGTLENQIRNEILNYNLENEVKMIGSIPSDEVRNYLRKVDVLLATSDFNEGWGVVINEAMNSGCVVVASHAMGAVPTLIQHNYNGLIYENGNTDDAYMMIKELVQDRNKALNIGKNAFDTIKNSYNPEVYADRFIELCNKVHQNLEIEIYEGIGKKAEIIKNSDYKNLLNG